MFDPTLSLVLITALVSALNPYTIGVLILLVTVVYGSGRLRRHVFELGLTYILTMFVVSFLGGMALLYLFTLLPLIAANYLALGIGILVVCAGLLEIKDFFWYGQGLSLGMPKLAASNIKILTKKRPSFVSAIGLGLFVAIITTPGSSAPYFATITLLRDHFNTNSINLLALYSGIFMLPMLILLGLLTVGGMRVSTIQRWKEEGKGKMRLGVGILLIALGWVLILATNGVLNFG
jgi:cytochrome c biogenesis protein CcdA